MVTTLREKYVRQNENNFLTKKKKLVELIQKYKYMIKKQFIYYYKHKKQDPMKPNHGYTSSFFTTLTTFELR